jgi:predicted nucleic acid-binding protein
VNGIVVDTSIWIDFFRGVELPALEDALRAGIAILSPIVAAELLGAPLNRRHRNQLKSFLNDLPLHPTPFSHWIDVGELRASLAKRGFTISTPDAHVAQCALEIGGVLWTRDKIFTLVAEKVSLRIYLTNEDR